MVIVVAFWLGFCVLISVWARKLNRSGVSWFFVPLLISPLFAALVLWLIGKKEQREFEQSNLPVGMKEIKLR
jgi:putative effector of murein hydrolase